MRPVENWGLLASCIGTGLAIVFIKRLILSKKSLVNPLKQDSRLPVKPLEKSQKKRDAVLKQAFQPAFADEQWDAIVIGSGCGGLTTAALLSRAGKKVLVLEQHDQAGGACHTFINKGYEFDVGIHYIGEMDRPTLSRTLVEQISNGQIQWDSLGDEVDTVVINALTPEQREYKIPAGKGKWQGLLKKTFPEEAEGIDKFFALVGKASSSTQWLMIVKVLPLWIVKPLAAIGFFEKFFSFFQLNQRTTEEVVKSVTSNKDLQLLLSYIWGTYATPPSETGFPLHALLIKHFESGASYPRGGASEIALNVIPVIEASGGRVCVRVVVKEILVSAGKVEGVVVEKSGKIYKIPAKIVVSDAGVHNTVRKLLSPQVASNSRLWHVAKEMKEGIGCVSVFIGLNASNEELGLKQTNVWAFMGNDVEEDYHNFNGSSVEDVLDKDYPVIFVGFPSAKDSSWSERHPGKSTITVVTFAPWHWFKQWAGKTATKRGDEYDGMKNTLGHRIVQQVCKLFPAVEKNVDYVSVGTPVTNEYYLAADKGAIYGLDHPARRYRSDMAALLRPGTDIKGLYMTGQDLISSGFVSALYAGLLCAGEILERNLYLDLVALHKKIKSEKKNN